MKHTMLRKLAAALTAAVCAAAFMAVPAAAAVDNGAVYEIETNKLENWPQMGNLYSETACLMDAETGSVLVDKGMLNERYPASITKVMTTLLALENSQLTDEVTFTEAGLARITEGTSIDSKVGEVMTMETCLNVVMMVSANEVAAQVAIQVAGSEEAFAQMMNEKAASLGCQKTHFTNASGLPDENHYTCAYDMALIFRAALQNEEFVKIIQNRAYTVPPTNMHPEARGYSTHLPLAAPAAPEYYADCIGGKTGVTVASLNTLVTASKRNDVTLIAVAMRADPGQVCADSTAMYEYGFNNFSRLALEGGSALLPSGVTQENLTEQAEETETATVTTYYYGDHQVGKTEVTPTPTPEPEITETSTPAVEADSNVVTPSQSNPILENKGFAVTVGALCGLILLGLILILISLISKLRR